MKVYLDSIFNPLILVAQDYLNLMNYTWIQYLILHNPCCLGLSEPDERIPGFCIKSSIILVAQDYLNLMNVYLESVFDPL